MRDDHGPTATAYGERPGRGRSTLRRRLLIAALLVVALVAAMTVAAGMRLNGNISRVDIDTGSGARPTGVQGDLNILVIGSDTRADLETTDYGVGTAEGGPRSDTNLLVHIAADRESAQVISIPRDSMTKAPDNCADPTDTVDDGELRRWNDNFNKGGPSCVVKTFEGLTGIFVDHVGVLDFGGFQSMVDGLGGVDVCLPSAVEDEDAQISLPAGRQRLDGKEALGYVRMRKTLGDGSDLQRIERQQTFMSSMAQEATRSSLLLRPDRLYSFLSAATRSMTTDDDLGLTRMLSIAKSVNGIDTADLVFATVPTEPYPKNPNRVQWRERASDELWTAVREDRALPGEEEDRAETAKLTVRPSEVTVSVVNDTRTPGLAAQEATALRYQGFDAGATADSTWPGSAKGVTVKHATGDAGSARTVAAAYRGAKLAVDETLTKGEVRLILGEGAPTASEIPNREGTRELPEPDVTAPPAPSPASPRTADEDICG